MWLYRYVIEFPLPWLREVRISNMTIPYKEGAHIYFVLDLEYLFSVFIPTVTVAKSSLVDF